MSGDIENNDKPGDPATAEEGSEFWTSREDNLYHMVVSAGLTKTTELNGFVITGGCARGSDSLGDYPGVVQSINRSYGGGIACYGSKNEVVSFYGKNLRITENDAGYGGGVYINAYANPVFVNTLIDNNYSVQGGGVYIYASGGVSSPPFPGLRSATASNVPLFTNVTIADNVAGDSGSGVYALRNAKLYNSIVWGNTPLTYTYQDDEGQQVTVPNGIFVSAAVNKQNSIIQDDFDPEDEDIDYPNYPLFVNPTDATISLRDYRLQLGSPAIDEGEDQYYYDAVGGEDNYLDDERDLGAIARIIGTAIDMGPYEADPCPPIVVWLGTVSADWQDSDNWYPAMVPASCTDVYIPGNVTTFPNLMAVTDPQENICRNIYFMPGAQLGQSQLLTYERAYVQLNYGKLASGSPDQKETTKEDLVSSGKYDRDAVTSEQRVQFGAATAGVTLGRERWNMLSSPLKNVVTGDYAFGGFPMSYILKFSSEGKKSDGTMFAHGSWLPFNNETTYEFKPGEGFGHFLYGMEDDLLSLDNGDLWDQVSNKPQKRPMGIRAEDQKFGLAHSNGIIHLPFFDDQYLSDAHRNHVYNEPAKESTFHNFWQGGPTGFADLYQFTGNTTTIPRANSNRFIAPNEEMDFTYNAGTIEEPGQQFVLIGNPFMSALDFDAFYLNNYDKIKQGYQIYQGTFDNGYFTYVSSDDRMIAPMQSFLVELNDTYNRQQPLNFRFIAATMAKTDASVKLRATAAAENVLTITASNPAGEVSTILRREDEAEDGFCNRDLSKILNTPVKSSVPNIYTVTTDASGTRRALVVNTVKTNSVMLPVGLFTAYSGAMKLTISGMDSYDGRVDFIDMKEGARIDISGRSSFEYPFENESQLNAKGEAKTNESRFMISLGDKITGLPGVVSLPVIASVSDDDLIILSGSSNEIKRVRVYNVGGQLLFSENNINADYYRKNGILSVSSVYVVEVESEQGVESIKVIK